MIEYQVTVNGIEVSAQYTERAVNDIFLPLLKELTNRKKRKGQRILAMLAAPPGAGKSTLAGFLEELSHSRPELCGIQAIGMDGFHRRQEYLLSHDTQRDGKRFPMVEIKGAPVTFDLERLTARVKKIAAGEICGWPVYDRLLHNPVENALKVDGDIVLLEGNYLLLNENGWRDLSSCADYTIFLSADENMLRARLIDRKIKTGVDEKAAVRFVDFSDMPNVRVCLNHSLPAMLPLRIDAEGDFHICTKNEAKKENRF